jgi:hypothetical protein
MSITATEKFWVCLPLSDPTSYPSLHENEKAENRLLANGTFPAIQTPSPEHTPPPPEGRAPASPILLRRP